MWMQWKETKDGTKKLYLKRGAFRPWLPYDTQPEYEIESHPDHSLGWNTYQKLSSRGWQLVEAEYTFKDSKR